MTTPRAIPTLILLASLFAALPARPAFACSVGPDWNPVAESDIIISGVVTGWQRVPHPAGSPDMGFDAIRLSIAVEDVLKGEAGGNLAAVDTASLHKDTGQWLGSSGACGAFNADPTGLYVFLGLRRAEDGSLRTSLPQMFFIGERESFAGARYVRTGEILTSFGLTRLPATGHGSMASQASQPDYFVLVLAGTLFAAGLGSLKLARRTT